MDPVSLSVVVPCFNESAGLDELHRRVSGVLSSVGTSYELVLINDGSTDQTWSKMVELCRSDPSVRAISLSRNFGHQLALSAGLSLARGDAILILDADLQDPPELLPQMLDAMKSGADVVYGKRVEREGENWIKKTTATAFYRFLNLLSDNSIPRDTGDFRLLSRRVLDVLNAMPEPHRFIRGMIAWIGFKQVSIGYVRQSRFAGHTKYPFMKMVRFALDAITSFSVKPLKISIWLGTMTSALALLMLIFTVVAWYEDLAVVGWSSLFAAIAFFSGTQLLILGIIGEYLARIVETSRKRPLFVIDQVASYGSLHDDRLVPGDADSGALN